jgi:hypothetical protein
VCIAVGSYSNQDGQTFTLAERWTGHKWSIQRTPNPKDGGALGGISCTSSTSCVAAGFDNWASGAHPFVERWNGHKWSIQQLPNPVKAVYTSLKSVSCTSSQACTAVGNYGTNGKYVSLAERWNGKNWSVQSTPQPGYQSYLSSVACSSSAACTAIGFYNQGKSINLGSLLTERWNGHKWTVQATPTPGATGVTSAGFGGVACTSSISCKAVGSYSVGSNTFTLAERWRAGH